MNDAASVVEIVPQALAVPTLEYQRCVSVLTPTIVSKYAQKLKG